ncbi:hypothetical protein [Membranihabitans maritimus]|nr:hypothetical protein [Membranihabitans maritimus]
MEKSELIIELQKVLDEIRKLKNTVNKMGVEIQTLKDSFKQIKGNNLS